MIKLLDDLRFFIGAFFLIIGGLLTIEGLQSHVLVEGYNLNLITGVTFVVFAFLALFLAFKAKKK